MPLSPLRTVLSTTAVAATLSACQRQERLSTELTNARLTPVLWEAPDSPALPDSSGPLHNDCALRLRDQVTGTEYQIQRRHAIRTNPDAPAGTAATWAQKGDYLRILTSPGGPPSSYIQVECGTWRVLARVSSR